MIAIALEPIDGRGPWKEYLCRACGLIYNERDGDTDSGIAPGTRFEDIPDDWCCPICGVRKQDFEPYERPAVRAPEGDANRPNLRQGKGGAVIIGAGIAGWAVAGELRKRDAHMPITLITQCAGDVYHKPELAIAFARGLSPEKLKRECGEEAAHRLNVRLVKQCTVVGLAPRFKKVRTTRGTFSYDHLVIAAGARAQVPQGLDPALCWRINHLQGWSGLHNALKDGTRQVAIIGTGMVGCELAEDLARAGHQVHLAGLTAEPMAGFLPAEAGARVRQGLEALGVRFMQMSALRKAVRLPHGRICLQLTAPDGSLLEQEVDQLVSAIGVATPSRLFQSAGLAFNNGLVVDAHTLQTSQAHIYALGDCISIDNAPCRFVEPILRQAETIAARLTGDMAQAYAHRPPAIRLKMRAAPILIEGQVCRDGEWRTLHQSAERLEMAQYRNGHITARLVA